MDESGLHKAIALAESLGHVFVATVDPKGAPHIAAAGRIVLGAEGYVEVTAWFCPATVANIRSNRRVSLLVWDPRTDIGYQLLGEAEKVDEVAVLDGYAPELEKQPPVPQAEERLQVRVDKVLDFKHAPHSDIEAR